MDSYAYTSTVIKMLAILILSFVSCTAGTSSSSSTSSSSAQINDISSSRSVASQQTESELVSVVVIYRHGDRTPVDPYPLDPYRDASFWPVGFGQLTNLGKQQHYELGKWLRARYVDFLPAAYNENDIFVRATDVDRTLMSAAANLAGLYPPTANADIWNADLKWQPIPVHTQPEEDDVLLAMKTNCPRYNYLMQQQLLDPYFEALAKRNKPLYEYITKSTGRTVDSLQSLEYIYNTLYIEQLYNYSLPAWTQRVYPEVMRPLAVLSFALPCYNANLARLKIGPLMFEIGKHLRNATDPKLFAPEVYHPRGAAPYIESRAKRDRAKKMWAYSAHDTTVANVLNALGVFEPHSPPYASTILFELKHSKTPTKTYFVNMYYKNSSLAMPLTLPGCDFDCDFATFESILRPLSVSTAQWYDECEQLSIISVLSFESVEGIVMFVLFVFVSMIIMMLIVCIFCAKPKCDSQMAYLRLPDDDETV